MPSTPAWMPDWLRKKARKDEDEITWRDYKQRLDTLGWDEEEPLELPHGLDPQGYMIHNGIVEDMHPSLPDKAYEYNSLLQRNQSRRWLKEKLGATPQSSTNIKEYIPAERGGKKKSDWGVREDAWRAKRRAGVPAPPQLWEMNDEEDVEAYANLLAMARESVARANSSSIPVQRNENSVIPLNSQVPVPIQKNPEPSAMASMDLEGMNGIRSYDVPTQAQMAFVNRGVKYGKRDAKVAAARKRKRRSKKRRSYKRRRTTGTRGRGVIVTPYGTLTGLGGYYDESQRGDFAPNYGARLGSVMGEGVHSFMNMLGFGDYSVKSNSLMNRIDMGTSPPIVRNSQRGEAIILSHREYIGDLVTPAFVGGATATAYAVQNFAINPGNAALFPFGSQIAANFQEYEMRGMIVELKTLSSDYTANLSMGSHFAGTEYNAYATPPQNKQQLENLQYSTSAKPSCSIIHPIECAPINDVNTHLYVAIDSDYKSGDKRLYDMGQLFIGSAAIPAASTSIAEIWVSYEIALFKPILSQGNLKSFIWQNTGVAIGTGYGTAVGASIGANNYAGITWDLPSRVMTFPPVIGRWLVVVTWAESAATTWSPVFNVTPVNSTLLYWFDSTGATRNNANHTTVNASTRQSMTFGLDVTQIPTGGQYPSVTLSGEITALAGTGTVTIIATNWNGLTQALP